MQQVIVVNISDMKVSRKHGDVLTTYSLGSCVGVAAWDPKALVGGLIHCLLPLSTSSPERARENPYMFVNTGVGTMLKTLFRMGATRETVVIKAAGGANMRGDDLFHTGSRNTEVLRELLTRHGFTLAAGEFGGSIPRGLTLCTDTGRVTVKTFGKEHDL
ncbi:chemotaxis protein CheD [Desulfovibrio sp.]